MKQTTFASLAWNAKGRTTRRERFLAEMNAVVPWARLTTLIEPHYPKAGSGRPPLPLERMLRIYFMQQWFNLSDPQAEDSLYDSESMRRFAGVELAEDVIPDETSILRFRHLLEEHKLTEAIFGEIRTLLDNKGLLLRSGTIVDATIIAAPSSTKNAQGERDPEMHQTRKGKDWYFGMKVHVGTSKQGLVHSLATGPAMRRTSAASTICCMVRRGNSTAIRPTGAKTTGSSASMRAFATGSIAKRATAS
jgi:transposase